MSIASEYHHLILVDDASVPISGLGVYLVDLEGKFILFFELLRGVIIGVTQDGVACIQLKGHCLTHLTFFHHCCIVVETWIIVNKDEGAFHFHGSWRLIDALFVVVQEAIGVFVLVSHHFQTFDVVVAMSLFHLSGQSWNDAESVLSAQGWIVSISFCGGESSRGVRSTTHSIGH